MVRMRFHDTNRRQLNLTIRIVCRAEGSLEYLLELQLRIGWLTKLVCTGGSSQPLSVMGIQIYLLHTLNGANANRLAQQCKLLNLSHSVKCFNHGQDWPFGQRLSPLNKFSHHFFPWWYFSFDYLHLSWIYWVDWYKYFPSFLKGYHWSSDRTMQRRMLQASLKNTSWPGAWALS